MASLDLNELSCSEMLSQYPNIELPVSFKGLFQYKNAILPE